MKHVKGAFEKLQERGFIHSASHMEETKKALDVGPVTFYHGIDPTADNLHIGHFFGLQIFKILQDYGHNGVLLVGNATAKIGDPSFKSDMRKPMTAEEVNHNAYSIGKAVSRFVDTQRTRIVFNDDWMRGRDFVDFAFSVGTHFNIAEMLSKDCYKNRLGSGLTFFELSYMLMQSFDFIHLNNTLGCTLQIGGSDQWANILAGVELGRKMSLENGKPRPLMMGFCYPLLTNSEGVKMGKTEKGVLWVNSDKTSPYEFYQHFYNVADEDVEKLLMFFTDLPPAEIKAMCKNDIIAAKKYMATAITQKIHGEFALDIPTETVDAGKGATLVDILALTSIIKSKREARELIEGGAILVDDEKIADVNYCPIKKEFLVKKGKKTFLKIVLKG